MDNGEHEHVRNRLNRVLVERGLTEVTVATKARMDQGHFNRVKNGRVAPNLLTALRIATALDLPVGTLFYLEGMRPDPGTAR